MRKDLGYMTARRLFVIGIAALGLLLAGCGGGGSGGGGGGSSNTWVGKIEETDAYIVMMSKDSTRFVYVTDGKELSMLFKGDTGLTDPNAFFTLRDLENRVINVQAPQGSTYKGLITVAPGQHLSFSITPAKGEAGLYRAKEGADQSYWIVLEDGSFRGAKVSTDGKVEALAARGGVKWSDATTDP